MATLKELLDFNNAYAPVQLKRFRDRASAEKSVKILLSQLWADPKYMSDREQTLRALGRALVPEVVKITRPAISSSLKLDRRIICLDTKEQWPNAYAMYRERKDWMTSAQQDRLTLRLYSAAKKGERALVEVNGRDFMLVNVQEIES